MHRPALHLHGAGGGGIQPRQQVQEGGLAALARAEQHQELVLPHLKTHVAQHRVLAAGRAFKAVGQVFAAQDYLACLFHLQSLPSSARIRVERRYPITPIAIMPTMIWVMLPLFMPMVMIQPTPFWE